MTIILSEMQKEAVNQIKNWFHYDDKLLFKLVGYAGTGKSTLVNAALEELKVSKDEVVMVAYTGKASLVLATKNPKYNCCTIHRLAYTIDDDHMTTEFVLREKEELKKLKLIIVDEASMVDENVANDLMSFGIKMLCLGDTGQLEPINGNSTLLINPDVSLTEIHRQAADSPIIHLSMLARQGKQIQPGKYGNNAYVISKRDITNEKLLSICMRANQVLCGYNRTRQNMNQKMRNAMGFFSEEPQIGEKLICIKNNWRESIGDIFLVNGMTGTLRSIEEGEKGRNYERDFYCLNFQPDFLEEKNQFKKLNVLKSDFTSKVEQLSKFEYSVYDSFDFGHSITVHKSQGSQWNNVVLFNEVITSESHHKWLYTGITRAAQNLIIIV